MKTFKDFIMESSELLELSTEVMSRAYKKARNDFAAGQKTLRNNPDDHPEVLNLLKKRYRLLRRTTNRLLAKTNEDTLLEVFDSHHPFEHVGSSGGIHNYKFTDKHGTDTHVAFMHHPRYPYAEVSFTVGDDSDPDSFHPTNHARHLSHRNFATVTKIMDHHAEKHPELKSYTFSGANDSKARGALSSRQRLYDRYVKKSGGQIKPSEDYSHTEYSIPIKRKDTV